MTCDWLTEVDKEISIEKELKLAGVASSHENAGGEQGNHQSCDSPIYTVHNDYNVRHWMMTVTMTTSRQNPSCRQG